MNRSKIADDMSQRILAADVGILNDHNVSDETMSLLAGEHAARVEALGKAVDPTLGRPLLVMIAGALMKAAKQIEEATTIVPVLVHA